ncbi:MAG: trypsin-like peptidase domain-containing protein, partial [Aggregatilineales bacterium]
PRLNASKLLMIAFVVVIALGVFSAPVSAQEDSPALTPLEQILSDLYNRISPSVVSIEIDEQGGSSGVFIPLSSGSGFVIDNQGHIVTNFHVIDGADRIAVNFFDGTITRAIVVGTDPASDLAVIRVDVPPERLQPITFANSDNLIIGQQTIALGSPFGERWTMTLGIVSALDRTIEGFTSFSIGGVIQTDTPINPGNSGGPLLNLAGEVIGVNSQIISENRINVGVGFAVPSNLTARVAQELIENGRVNYSYIGVNGDEVNIDYIERYGLPNDTRGVVVTRIVGNAPAQQGGLQAISNSSVDIITAVDGRPVMNLSMLIGYLSSSTAPGQTVTMTVLRDGQTINLPIILTERP